MCPFAAILIYSVNVMLPKFCNKSVISRLSLEIFSEVSSEQKMETITANRQNSSGPEPIEDVFSSPNHTSLSFYHINPLNSNTNYEEYLSADARQAITSHPFFGRSDNLSYSSPFSLVYVIDHQLRFSLGVNHQPSARLYENNEPDAQTYNSIPTSGKTIICVDCIFLVLIAKLLTLTFLNSHRAVSIQPCIHRSCFVRN